MEEKGVGIGTDKANGGSNWRDEKKTKGWRVEREEEEEEEKLGLAA